ncbi:hypothetical protein GW17_00017564 [Ensete ventricosum]|nr:hypothetical protein GW17_00017564 [Ensete ventricosum]RZS21436.1 hypothetical protein BHM03_00054078 [Ensete ventricosum]
MSYKRSFSRADDKLRSFRSCLRWMCVDQSDTRYVMVFWSLFLLLGIFVPTAFHFVVSCTSTYHAYYVVVQLSHLRL